MTLSTRRRPIAILVIGAAVVALSACSAFGPLVPADEPVRDDDGRIIEPNEQTDAFALQVGDCLDDGTATGEVQTVPTVPCDEPHDSEIYSAHLLGQSQYPGDDIVVDKAEALCLPAFEQFVGEPYLESRFDFSFYYPTAESWATGDREVLCVIYDPEGPVTGTLEGVTD
ncbi:septum formation family protein [Microcella sp.]|uniref:septum formation family protein n=1 Tax=Microcella sp. TaxID=1913979 RepID=UPI0039188DC1